MSWQVKSLLKMYFMKIRIVNRKDCLAGDLSSTWYSSFGSLNVHWIQRILPRANRMCPSLSQVSDTRHIPEEYQSILFATDCADENQHGSTPCSWGQITRVKPNGMPSTSLGSGPNEYKRSMQWSYRSGSGPQGSSFGERTWGPQGDIVPPTVLQGEAWAEASASDSLVSLDSWGQQLRSWTLSSSSERKPENQVGEADFFLVRGKYDRNRTGYRASSSEEAWWL